MPKPSALGVGLANRIQSVLDRVLQILAVSEAGLGDPCAFLAGGLPQVLPTGMKPTLLSQVDEEPHKKNKLIYLPPTLGNARSSLDGANVENRHGE